MNYAANIRNFCEKNATYCIFLTETPKICSALQIYYSLYNKVEKA